jgi:hypothetical protein
MRTELFFYEKLFKRNFVLQQSVAVQPLEKSMFRPKA